MLRTLHAHSCLVVWCVPTRSTQASRMPFSYYTNVMCSVFFKQEKLLKNGFLSNFRREAAKSLSNFLSNSSKKTRFLNIFLSNFWSKKVKYVFKQFWWLFFVKHFFKQFSPRSGEKNSTFLSNFRREAPKNKNSLKTTGKFVKNMSF